jgi:hypothetical protein
VKENHGELVPLLSWLEKERPQAYQKAVGSIGRSATQISQLKNRNPDRYKTELRSWQLQSRIQLLAAQLAVKDTDEKRKELRGLVDESLDLRVDRLVDDVAAMEKRIEKMNDEIERLSSDRSKAVDAAMEKVVRTSKRMRDRKKKKPMKEDLETGQPVEDAETAKKTAAKKKKKAAEKKRKKDAKKKSESNDSAGE